MLVSTFTKCAFVWILLSAFSHFYRITWNTTISMTRCSLSSCLWQRSLYWISSQRIPCGNWLTFGEQWQIIKGRENEKTIFAFTFMHRHTGKFINLSNYNFIIRLLVPFLHFYDRNRKYITHSPDFLRQQQSEHQRQPISTMTTSLMPTHRDQCASDGEYTLMLFTTDKSAPAFENVPHCRVKQTCVKSSK